MEQYSQLSLDDRERIAVMKSAGHSNTVIALALGRHPSTIGRELKRNKMDSGRYSPLAAEGACRARRHRSARLERDEALATFVRQRLVEGWSPQQIAGWLASGAEPGLATVVLETIYSFIYRAGQKAEELWRYLTRRHKKRRPLRARAARDTIKERVSIHERPDEVETRLKVGHWEGDLILCKNSRPVLVLHERKTRITLANRLTGKGAAETASSIMAIFKRLDPGLRLSITFDNGGEFAKHTWLREALGMATYFCDAYASWQKGGVENTNGRLRRWLPRQTNLDDVSDHDIQEIVMTYNLTPRKCLGYKTPLQALFSEYGKDVTIRFA